VNSNASRSAPPPNTGSAFLNGVSALATVLTQAERRVDPFFRPAFDAVLREPLARLTTALINRGRRVRSRRASTAAASVPESW
jgi:hypothetical protein